jgi:hypothetical protein
MKNPSPHPKTERMRELSPKVGVPPTGIDCGEERNPRSASYLLLVICKKMFAHPYNKQLASRVIPRKKDVG